MRGRIPRPSPALFVACIALAVALSGASYAAIIVPRNSVGPLQLKANAVNSSKVLNGSLLRADFKAGQVPAGPPGPAGPAGAAGAAGPAGPAGPGAKWALVRADGSILAQSGGLSVSSHPSPGVYIINYGSAVTGKLILTSGGARDANYRGTVQAGPCGGPPEGFSCVSGNDTSHVVVFTLNPANTALVDIASFYVAVIG